MKTKDKYYVGTDLKFLLKIESPGFSQADDDYEVTLVCGSKPPITIHKSEIVEGEDGYYLLVDSSRLDSGVVRMIVTVKVPDDDFEKGFRREVEAKDLCIIKKTY